ncbi:MAG: hypothetical protein HGA74_07230, partial [Deltaproteobacteria bacterium]|nr:hypothetical protein [Deltaproteobacteria bacterium]
LVWVIDGSTVGRSCIALMVTLADGQRCLSIAWTVVEGKKGHFPGGMHVELVKQVQKIIPEGAQALLPGDGELDGINLQAIIHHWQWKDVARTAKTPVLTREDRDTSFDDVAEHVLLEGDHLEIPSGCRGS